MRISPDRICKEFAKKKAKITIRALADDAPHILIEGDQKGLEFLGELLLAQAQSRKDCGFQLDPRGAGKVFFSKASQCGLYIHRVHSADDKSKTPGRSLRKRAAEV